MFRLRREQVEAYRLELVEAFETRAVSHLRRCLAEETRQESDEELRRRVRSCINRAARYGVTVESAVLLFVDVTCLLGFDFDTGPHAALVGEVLSDSELDQSEKMNQLIDLAYELREATGDDGSRP